MAGSDKSDDVGERVEAVKTLLQLFKVERAVYIAVIIISVIILLISAVSAAITSGFNPTIVIGLFGPSGAIVVMTGRLLKMWTDATEIVRGQQTS